MWFFAMQSFFDRWDHSQFSALWSSGCRLATQGRKQILLSTKRLRVSAFPGTRNIIFQVFFIISFVFQYSPSICQRVLHIFYNCVWLFILQDEGSVQQLIDACIQDEDKLYLCVSSPTIKDKPVQIRPWRLSDADFVLDASMPLDPRKTVFVGGVPRPLKAVELAMIMDRLYGGVCYAGIDTDPELKYPKGAGRVAFSNQQSYIAAISARFVQLQHGDIDKRVSTKGNNNSSLSSS